MMDVHEQLKLGCDIRDATDRLAWWFSQPATDSQRGESIRCILEDIREIKKALRKGER